jgi:hypothetical protein
MNKIVSQAPEKTIFNSNPQVLSPPKEFGFIFFNLNKAWAVEKNNFKYFLVIGEYYSEEDAWKEYNIVRRKRFRSDSYLNKDLNVVKINDSEYLLVYTTMESGDEAENAYKIMAINDPDINVTIYRYEEP